MVPAHLICMQLVNKFWRFHKDAPAAMKRFITFFSPGALNWVALLPSKFYLPGNMQMLVGQLRNREEFQRQGNEATTQVCFPLQPGTMQPLIVHPPRILEVFSTSFQSLLCLLLTDSVSDSAFEKGELVLGNRQLDCAVMEAKRKGEEQ